MDHQTANLRCVPGLANSVDKSILWIYKDSERRFQHVLEAFGVNKPLSKMGVKEGDSVIVGEVRILIGLSNVKKLSFDPTKWSGSNPSVLNSKSIVTEFLSIMTIMIEYIHGAK
ncbi:hypothetical protein D5086_017288 [Populus alba]|uniref:Uncharacterized protein n=1 Tax=Populus alba TaxID=43335 RepID=A0ACC4BX07_POPAL